MLQPGKKKKKRTANLNQRSNVFSLRLCLRYPALCIPRIPIALNKQLSTVPHRLGSRIPFLPLSSRLFAEGLRSLHYTVHIALYQKRISISSFLTPLEAPGDRGTHPCFVYTVHTIATGPQLEAGQTQSWGSSGQSEVHVRIPCLLPLD